VGVVLHIGLCKTGTTSIQHCLRDHEELLAEHGVRVPRGWLLLNNHFELPLTLMRLDRMSVARSRADEWRNARWRWNVLGQVVDDLIAHRDELTILSAEALSLFRYDDELEVLGAIVGDAEVVAYLRRPEDFLASLAGHYAKAGMPGLSSDPEAFNYLAADSWRADYDKLLALWRRHFSRVTTISYDAVTERDGSVVPSFFRRLDVPVPWDVMAYRLNRRPDPIPRVAGNRARGLRFGDR
jgi:hypothetical protein